MTPAAPAKPGSALDIWSAEQLSLIRSKVAPQCPDDELRFFATICANHDLDPFLREIHFVPRNQKEGQNYVKKWTVQIGIDGYRKIAGRTGQYAGSDDAVFDEQSDKPRKASVTVYRMVNGVRCPFTASARWSEYCPSQENARYIWNARPFGQLAKCAEALALRKAFPDTLAGLYIEEEMQKEDEPMATGGMSKEDAMTAIRRVRTPEELDTLKLKLSTDIGHLPKDEQNEIMDAVAGRTFDTKKAAPKAKVVDAEIVETKPATVRSKDELLKAIDACNTVEELKAIRPEINDCANALSSGADKEDLIMAAKRRFETIEKIGELKDEVEGEPVEDPRAKTTIPDAEVEKLVESMKQEKALPSLVALWNSIQEMATTPAQHVVLTETYESMKKSLSSSPK